MGREVSPFTKSIRLRVMTMLAKRNKVLKSERTLDVAQA
jgi:hypothetical protein